MHISSRAPTFAVSALVAFAASSTVEAANAADLYGSRGRERRPTFERSTDDGWSRAARPGIWGGFYAGLDGGYAWARGEPDGHHGRINLDGSTLGAHVGYNWQRGNWVVGAEADLGFRWADGVRNYPDPMRLAMATNMLSSLRGRVGYAFDNMLVYATGGAALGQFEARRFTPTSFGGDSDLFAGWVLGGGVEMKLTQSLSGRVEALHYRFGGTFELPGSNMDADVSTTTLRAGLTYHFN